MIITIEIHSEEGEDIAAFYERVHSGMCRSGLDWCSTDDWYDNDGESIHEDVRAQARDAVLSKPKGVNA